MNFLPLVLILASTAFGTNLQDVGYSVALIVDAMKFCSGTLIHENYVVTTAECVYNAFEVDVVLGLTNLLQQAPSFYIISQESIKIHENFSENPLLYNLALIKIPKLNTYKFTVHILNLANIDNIQNGNEYKLSGYNVKNKQSLDLGKQNVKVDNQYCQYYNGCLNYPTDFFSVIAKDDTNLTGFQNIGSPVIQNENLLVGITVCMLNYNEAGFVLKMASFVDWFQTNLI